jgi:hypothetical protein
MSYDVFIGRAGSATPGTITRPNIPNERVSRLTLAATPVTTFGNPVAVDASTDKIRPITTGDTTANIFGALVRVFPTSSTSYANTDNTMTSASVNGDDVLTVLRKGYIAVQVKGATVSAHDGAVYVQTVANTGLPIGCISAAVDGTNNFVWVGATFVGGMDANGFAEIRIA